MRKKRSRLYQGYIQLASVFLMLMITSVNFECQGRDVNRRQVITLNGTAAGGVVSLALAQQICPRFITVPTAPGESAETVVKRLATEIERSDPFGWHGFQGVIITPGPPRQIPDVQVAGNTLTLLGVPYDLSGSDKGFIILKPVLSVSGSYDPEKKQIALSWINPLENYDKIHASGLELTPGTTNCVFDCSRIRPKDIFSKWHGIVLQRGAMLSPPASITLSTNSQEELDAFPFYMGVAPNWSSWVNSNEPDVAKFEQGSKPEVEPKGCIEDAYDKPFYQIVKVTKKDVQAGVWRRFLGLKSTHTYKVEARMNTLKMDASTNEWSVSFHAASDNTNGQGLTMAQMAGTEALPDGNNGATAGRIAIYGPDVTTKGKWAKCSTTDSGSHVGIKNITLPSGVSSITVWLRHSGIASTGVGLDWIRIEDVTK